MAYKGDGERLVATMSNWQDNPALQRRFDYSFGAYVTFLGWTRDGGFPDEREPEGAPLEDRAKFTWDHSGAVREEFLCFEDYVAYRRFEARGRERVVGGSGVRRGAQEPGGFQPAGAPLEERAKAAWNGSAELRGEFLDFEDYLAWRMREQASAGG